MQILELLKRFLKIKYCQARKGGDGERYQSIGLLLAQLLMFQVHLKGPGALHFKNRFHRLGPKKCLFYVDCATKNSVGQGDSQSTKLAQIFNKL
jgi:hypothetical protein